MGASDDARRTIGRPGAHVRRDAADHRGERRSHTVDVHEPVAARELVDELRVRNLADAYTIMGHTLRVTAEEAGTEINDPEAISAVLLAALSYVPIMKVMIGRNPGV